jgi:hypothetical protein
MADLTKYLAKATLKFQTTAEEKLCAEILFSQLEVQPGDQRLHKIAALTYNTQTCARIMNVIEKALNPTEFPHTTLYKALLLVHTLVLYGSEGAVTATLAMDRTIASFLTYNSALVKRSSMFSFMNSTSGTDYGAPVRDVAKKIDDLLKDDQSIRSARAEARSHHDDVLVPPPSSSTVGSVPTGASGASVPEQSLLNFGQAPSKALGAGYGLENIPGMYEGRPDRYFDSDNDARRTLLTGDHQWTREVQ